MNKREHKKMDEKIYDYVLGEKISELDKKRIEKHLEECQECRKKLINLLKIKEILKRKDRNDYAQILLKDAQDLIAQHKDLKLARILLKEAIRLSPKNREAKSLLNKLNYYLNSKDYLTEDIITFLKNIFKGKKIKIALLVDFSNKKLIGLLEDISSRFIIKPIPVQVRGEPTSYYYREIFELKKSNQEFVFDFLYDEKRIVIDTKNIPQSTKSFLFSSSLKLKKEANFFENKLIIPIFSKGKGIIVVYG